MHWLLLMTGYGGTAGSQCCSISTLTSFLKVLPCNRHSRDSDDAAAAPRNSCLHCGFAVSCACATACFPYRITGSGGDVGDTVLACADARLFDPACCWRSISPCRDEPWSFA